MKRFYRPLFIGLGLAALLAAACCPLGQRVVLRTREGELVYQQYLPRGETVWLLYTHSFNKGLVEDGYQPTQDGKVCLRRTRIRQYGAGIPEPEPGQTFTAYDGYYELAGLDREMDVQWTYVGRIADHRLRVGEDGQVVHYDQLAQPGTMLGLSFEPLSLCGELAWRWGLA